MSRSKVVMPSTRQRGSALIISLVMLTLLMLTAVGSISSSIVQERMAHNASQLNQRFQAAESGLRYVEQQVRAQTLALPGASCVSIDCDVAAGIMAPANTALAPGAGWVEVPKVLLSGDTQVWYRVVRLGDTSLSTALAAGSASTLYRVSVISQQNSARTLLEGVYAFSRI